MRSALVGLQLVGAINLAVAAWPQTAGAVDYTWAAAAAGNWNDNTKWNSNPVTPLGIPNQAADKALLNRAGAAHTVTLNISPTIDDVTLDSPNVTLAAVGRTLTVAGGTIKRGTVHWSGSTWTGTGALTIEAGGSLLIDGNSELSPGGVIGNSGTIRLRAIGGNAAKATVKISVDIAATGKLILTSEGAAAGAEWDQQLGQLINAGEVRIEQGAFGGRTLKTGGPFTNTGTVKVGHTCNFDLRGNDFSNFGTFDVSANQSAVFLGNEFINDKLGNAVGKLVGEPQIDVSGMTVKKITNKAKVAPGGGNQPGPVVLAGQFGTVSIVGGYVQTGGGLLEIELGGSSAGTDYDQLAVSDTAALGDTLRVGLVNGFHPSLNATFDVLTCAARIGTFSVLQLPPGMSIEYLSNGVRLRQTQVPVPGVTPWLAFVLLIGLVGIGGVALHRQLGKFSGRPS
jgi:hypothetical protein